MVGGLIYGFLTRNHSASREAVKPAREVSMMRCAMPLTRGALETEKLRAHRREYQGQARVYWVRTSARRVRVSGGLSERIVFIANLAAANDAGRIEALREINGTQTRP
jgi:hypothetical protein